MPQQGGAEQAPNAPPRSKRTAKRAPNARGRTKRTARRGRPLGSVSLSKQVRETILNYIRAGAFGYVAAEAAGIAERTFHDWIARGEGRQPSRPATPALREFALDVRKAQAEARVGAEVKVYRENPTYWLSRVARTRPDREGWTDPPQGSEPGYGIDTRDLARFSDEELAEARSRLHMAMVANGSYTSPPCSHARCRCPHHEKNKRDR